MPKSVRSKMILSSLGVMLLNFIFGAYLIATYKEIPKNFEISSSVNSIVRDIFSLSNSLNDFALLDLQRGTVQWTAARQSLEDNFRELSLLYDAETHRVAELDETLEYVDLLMSALIEGRYETSLGRSRAINQVNIKLQDMIFTSQLLVVSAEQQLIETQRQTDMLIIFFVIFVAAIVGLAMLMFHRTVLAPMQKLQRGLEKIGQANFSYRIQHPRDDEYGKLADGFNGMAENLLHLTTTKAELLDKERTTREEAERANQLKDELLATVSHELRTPLGVISGWVDILRNGRIPRQEYPRIFDTLNDNVELELQLVDDLLDTSRSMRGKVHLEKSFVEMNDIVEKAVETVRFAAEQKNIELDFQLDSYKAGVRGDERRLEQIIWSLLANAVKFTPKGGKVGVTLSRKEGMVEVSVADDGIGIDPDFLPHIFEPFRQQESSLSRTYGGLGMGLTIVKNLVELHGGTIKATSRGKNKGATFIVSLPLAPVSAKEGPGKKAKNGFGLQWGTETKPLQNIKILLIDDMPEVLHLLEIMLKRFGAEVYSAESVTAAVDLFKDVLPNVIISDISMPGQDGYDLVRKIRALPEEEGGRTPIIALSANAGQDVASKAISHGFQMYLTKPVDLPTLIGAITQLCGVSKSEEGTPAADAFAVNS